MMRALTSFLLAGALLAPAATAAGGVTRRLALVDVHVVRGSHVLVAEAGVRRSPHARRVRSAKVSCIGAIGRRPLRVHRGRLVHGLATCHWTFGRRVRGKRFRGAIFVRSGRATAHAFVTARLR